MAAAGAGRSHTLTLPHPHGDRQGLRQRQLTHSRSHALTNSPSPPHSPTLTGSTKLATNIPTLLYRECRHYITKLRQMPPRSCEKCSGHLAFAFHGHRRVKCAAATITASRYRSADRRVWERWGKKMRFYLGAATAQFVKITLGDGKCLLQLRQADRRAVEGLHCQLGDIAGCDFLQRSSCQGKSEFVQPHERLSCGIGLDLDG